MLVSWQASAARAGQVRYRVRRDTGRAPGSPAEGIEIADQTTELHTADENIPPGVDLHYAVFAGRGGPRWSPPPASQVLFTPDVSEVNLNVAADAVGAAWRVPRGAAEVEVTRTADRDQARITADPTGFTDTGLTPGDAVHVPDQRGLPGRRRLGSYLAGRNRPGDSDRRRRSRSRTCRSRPGRRPSS